MNERLLVGSLACARDDGAPGAAQLFWCEPFGEGIPASLFRELSFVRTPPQTADANCEGAKLPPILFPLLPHFKLHARFAHRYVFLQRCRNPFGGPALLATFHNCSVTRGANDNQEVNSNQIRRPRVSLSAKMIVSRFGDTAFRRKGLPGGSLGMTGVQEMPMQFV